MQKDAELSVSIIITYRTNIHLILLFVYPILLIETEPSDKGLLLKQPELVPFKKSWMTKSQQYADGVVGTVNYADSSQKNLDKIKNDHYTGKIAEFCAHHLLKGDFDINPPDCEIYKGKKKSWESDLIGKINFAIKSQTFKSYKLYGASIMFQDIKGGRRDPILDEPESKVVYVVVGDQFGIVVPPVEVKNLILDEPELWHLKGKKSVAYLERSHESFIKDIDRMIKK